MTDLVTRPDAEGAPESAPPTAGDTGDGSTEVYEWAPAEPAPKKRHLGWWIGVPAGLVVIALVVSSLLLIAPGTAVAGVQIGGMTQGAAAEAIADRLAETTVKLTGAGGDVTLTAAQLGATVDAEKLAADAFAAHPAWQVADWNSESADAAITIDSDTATAALQKAAPGLFADPTNASVGFDGTNYAVTPAAEGKGVDLDALTAQLQQAFDSGSPSLAVEPTAVAVQAATTTEYAQQTADKLNTMLDGVGFYVGDERTVPVDRATAASWLTLTPADDGTISLTADPAKIQPTVDGLAAQVDRAPVNGTVITDTAGKVLSTKTAGIDGRTLGDTSGVANSFAQQLGEGNGAFQLTVAATPAQVTTLARSITVNLSEQHVYLYENGQVVNSWAISSGTAGHETKTGHFRITAKLATQNMGNPDLTKAPNYYTKNVPNVMYFNGDQALHGAYWHHNFGHVMSHGCVNMPLDAAAYTYQWAPMGTEVTVTY